MKIVHVYPKDDTAISRYVSLLPASMDDAGQGYPDIIHVHGCWDGLPSLTTPSSLRRRIVVTPHGGLQPWMLGEHKAQQLLERRLVSKAYALIAMGQQERDVLQKLGWNPRLETIANPLITRTTSKGQLVVEHYRLYQKVMDSYAWELLDDNSLQALRVLLKAGITGDRRWLSDMQVPSEAQWRPLLLYAFHEGVANVVAKGIEVTGIKAPDLDASKIDCYLPSKYSQPQTQNIPLLQLIKATLQSPTLCQLVDIDQQLRHSDIDEDKLIDELEEAELKDQTARLMQLTHELTALDEGFMPLEPLDDKQTQTLRKKLAERLNPRN